MAHRLVGSMKRQRQLHVTMRVRQLGQRKLVSVTSSNNLG